MFDDLSTHGGEAFFPLVKILSDGWNASREDRRRLEELSREKALERIEQLYRPLLSMLDPGPPYDDFHIDRKLGSRILKFIGEKEFYASPDLLTAFWSFRSHHHEVRGDVPRDVQWKLLEVADEEYSELKRLVGYGSIIKKPGVFKRLNKIFRKLLDKNFVPDTK